MNLLALCTPNVSCHVSGTTFSINRDTAPEISINAIFFHCLVKDVNLVFDLLPRHKLGQILSCFTK